MVKILAAFGDAIAAFLIAIGIEGANLAFFEKSQFGSMLAVLTAIIGILLAIQRWSINEARTADMQVINNLASTIDLSRSADESGLLSLTNTYLSITEPEFKSVKDQIVTDTQEQLRKLAIDKRSGELETTRYYDWLFNQFDRMTKGDVVRAVSLSSDEEWNDSQLEHNFLDANLRAASRGAQISRIFIVSDERFDKFIKLRPIEKHCLKSNSGLVGFSVSLEELQKYDPGTLKSVGEGFIEFVNKVGLEDTFDETGAARGRVTMLRQDLARMTSIYNRLINMAKPLE